MASQNPEIQNASALPERPIGSGPLGRLGNLWSHLLEKGSALPAGLRHLVGCGVLMVAYLFLFFWRKLSAHLPLEDYDSVFILPRWFVRIGENPLMGLPLLLILGVLAFRWRNMSNDWKGMENGHGLRWIVGAATIALAWPLAMSPYNFFADQWHILDRLLLVATAVLVFFRPWAILLFLTVAAPMSWEFEAAVHMYPWEFFGLPFRVLVLFEALFLIKLVSGSRGTSAFFFLLICIIAGHYWIPGIAKLRWGWLYDNQTQFLMAHAKIGLLSSQFDRHVYDKWKQLKWDEVEPMLKDQVEQRIFIEFAFSYSLIF